MEEKILNYLFEIKKCLKSVNRRWRYSERLIDLEIFYGTVIKIVMEVFPSFAPCLIKINLCRPQKQRANDQKNAQVDRNGLQNLTTAENQRCYNRGGKFCDAV